MHDESRQRQIQLTPATIRTCRRAMDHGHQGAAATRVSLLSLLCSPQIDSPGQFLSPGIHVLYASQILQPLAPHQPSVVQDPQNVAIVLARRYRNPMHQARMDIGG